MAIFFTSDLHFGHFNIIKFCSRPFNDAYMMDEVMITRWNETVKPEDSVYVLGDFSFRGPKESLNIFRRLSGQKFLIRGNHDKMDEVNKAFGWVKDLYDLKVDDPDARGGKQHIVLCHYAMRTWNKSYWGSWHLYGHTHGSMPEPVDSLSCDAGVDCWNFKPVSYEQIKEKMSRKTPKVPKLY